MNLKLSATTKIVIVVICFLSSVVGFLVKLPSAFHHIDKELHFAFYFLAAAFFNVLFGVKNLLWHLFISLLLLLFGIGIEFAQENYNRVFHVRFHGRYDPDDVRANLRGLVAFSIVWAIIMLVRLAMKSSSKAATDKS